MIFRCYLTGRPPPRVHSITYTGYPASPRSNACIMSEAYQKCWSDVKYKVLRSYTTTSPEGLDAVGAGPVRAIPCRVITAGAVASFRTQSRNRTLLARFGVKLLPRRPDWACSFTSSGCSVSLSGNTLERLDSNQQPPD